MAFNDRLKEARLFRKMTQEQIANQIGVAKSTFTGYEKGNSEPNMLTITKIMEVLKIDANFLFQDEMHELKNSNQTTPEEFENIVKKYRALDRHGKEMVDFTLEKEWERSTESTDNVISISVQPELNAAHQRTDIDIPEGTNTSDNDIMDDENF